jgi:hypothetical protein
MLPFLLEELFDCKVWSPSMSWDAIGHDWCSAGLLRVSYLSRRAIALLASYVRCESYRSPCFRLELGSNH